MKREHTALQDRFKDLTEKYAEARRDRIKESDTSNRLDELQTRYKQLEELHYSIIQEHNACGATRDDLRTMAGKWQVQTEKTAELESTCAQLRQALSEARANQNVIAPSRSLAKRLEISPLPIEASTMSDLEDSDEDTSRPEVPYTWSSGSKIPGQYELFLASSFNDGEFQGYSRYLSSSIDQALLQIAAVLRQAEADIGLDQYGAVTVLGMRLANMEPEYLFRSIETTDQTIFIGAKPIVEAYVAAVAARASSSQSDTLVMTIEEATIEAMSSQVHIRKRRDRDDESEDEEIRELISEGRVTTLSTKKSVGKRRILRLKNSEALEAQAEDPFTNDLTSTSF
jgi:hypothetical protein